VAGTPRVFLTGASGVVGAAVLAALPDCDVVALTHSSRLRDPGPRVRAVQGDLGAPGLGLDRRERAGLVGRGGRGLDVVVHCAAVTDFRRPAADTEATNVRGTHAVVELAADAGARLVHLSTAFLARRGLAPAADVAGSPAPYLDSKAAAEAVVTAGGVPCTLVRPSIVLGDSRTGEAAGFQGLHAVLAGLLRGELPVLPVGRDAAMDFVPSDVLARAVRRAVVQGAAGSSPETLWVTAGSAALTAGDLADLTVAVGREHGIDVAPPRFASARVVERSLGPAGADLPARVREHYRDVLALAALFTGAQAFPSDVVDAAGHAWAAGGPPLDPQPPRAVLRRCFAASAHYLVRERRLRSSRTADREPAALAPGA